MDITSDSDLVRALFELFGFTEQNPPREGQVVDIVSALGRLALEGTPLCDVGALIRTLTSFVGIIMIVLPKMHLTKIHCSTSNSIGRVLSNPSTGRIDMV